VALNRERFPYIHLVPKDSEGNRVFRRKMLQLAHQSRSNARDIWRMCARDLLFTVNTFCWTFDPRKPVSALPFITWEFQDDGFDQLLDVLGKQDLLSEKSRDMGLSWMMLTTLWWSWNFSPDTKSFLMVSRTEDLVDKKNDPDALFWKIDYIIDHLPRFLRPKLERNKLTLYNVDTKSSITGASTTSETGRGGRKTAIMLDEFAAVPDGHAMLKSTRDNTNCRLFNSTPQGTANAFYDMAQTDIRKIRFHWSLHPEKSVGIYTDVHGKQRSPWYDLQCKRAAHPQEIAQELDIDYMGSAYQFFNPQMLQEIAVGDVRPPFVTGELEYNPHTGEPADFVNSPNGHLQLWTYLEGQQRPMAGRQYVLGCDISAGTGASNSVIVIADKTTREQVGEYANSNVRPDQLAKVAAALGRWFHNGLVIWEANGPGREFGTALVDVGYNHVWFRKGVQDLYIKKISNFPGWFATKDTKVQLFGQFRAALAGRTIILRSRALITECMEYVFTPDQSVEHARSVSNIDPSGARTNHGDRPTAAALVVEAMGREHEPVELEPELPKHCLAGRRAAAEAKRKEAAYW
jgi:hypothetical protein